MLMIVGSVHAADRNQLLTDPGVFVTFAVFSVDRAWWEKDQEVRSRAVSEAGAVFQKHGTKIAIDAYLSRGLSDRADFFLRLHAEELIENQNFLLDLMGSTFGRHLVNLHTFNGITKKASYVPGFPDELKAALKASPDPGPKPYAAVIPIRKDAEWWSLDHQARTLLMKEHAEASVPYLKTVARKLYHASGLDDLGLYYLF
jgi:chlorite dismutase